MKVAESEIRRGALSSPSPWGGGEAWAFPHHHALPPTCLGEPCWQPRWYSMAMMTTGTMGELGTRAGYIRVRKMLCQKEPPSPGSWATTSPNNVAPKEVPGILQGHQLLSQGHWPRNGVVAPWSLSWSAGQGWLHLLDEWLKATHRSYNPIHGAFSKAPSSVSRRLLCPWDERRGLESPGEKEHGEHEWLQQSLSSRLPACCPS